MIIRGAPAIGVRRHGVALGVLHAGEEGLDGRCKPFATPWRRPVHGGQPVLAIDRMKRLYASLRGRPLEEIRRRLVEERFSCARKICICRAIGRNGAPLVPIIRPCSRIASGALRGGYGTRWRHSRRHRERQNGGRVC